MEKTPSNLSLATLVKRSGPAHLRYLQALAAGDHVPYSTATQKVTKQLFRWDCIAVDGSEWVLTPRGRMLLQQLEKGRME